MTSIGKNYKNSTEDKRKPDKGFLLIFYKNYDIIYIENKKRGN